MPDGKSPLSQAALSAQLFFLSILAPILRQTPFSLEKELFVPATRKRLSVIVKRCRFDTGPSRESDRFSVAELVELLQQQRWVGRVSNSQPEEGCLPSTLAGEEGDVSSGSSDALEFVEQASVKGHERVSGRQLMQAAASCSCGSDPHEKAGQSGGSCQPRVSGG